MDVVFMDVSVWVEGGGGVEGGGMVLGPTVGVYLFYVFFILLFPEVMEIK